MVPKYVIIIYFIYFVVTCIPYWTISYYYLLNNHIPLNNLLSFNSLIRFGGCVGIF